MEKDNQFTQNLDEKSEKELDEDIISVQKSKNSKHNKNKIYHSYIYQYVALKISYLGWQYHGFAIQLQDSTVEKELFKAFQKLSLTRGSLDKCKYSRCGRTDTNVNALCQVISCELRANYKIDNCLSDQEKNESDTKLYILALNSLLPRDIRVIAWCRVDQNFSARFNCISRTYKYYIPSKGLNLEDMQEASQLFLGEHDFRNFCKVSSNNQINHFMRRIKYISINPHHNDNDFLVFTVKGNAFLHNQIRNMIYILLVIGMKLEDKSIISNLLDIQKCPHKPQYSPLAGISLILFDCEFENIVWNTSSYPVLKDLQISYIQHKLKGLIYEDLLSNKDLFNSLIDDIPARTLMTAPFSLSHTPVMDLQKSCKFIYILDERSEKIDRMLKK